MTTIYPLKCWMIIILSVVMIGCQGTGREDPSSEREQMVQELFYLIESERRHAWSTGYMDGNGQLYKTMPSYAKLKTICSEQELRIVDLFLGPKSNELGATDERMLYLNESNSFIRRLAAERRRKENIDKVENLIERSLE